MGGSSWATQLALHGLYGKQVVTSVCSLRAVTAQAVTSLSPGWRLYLGKVLPFSLVFSRDCQPAFMLFRDHHSGASRYPDGRH